MAARRFNSRHGICWPQSLQGLRRSGGEDVISQVRSNRWPPLLDSRKLTRSSWPRRIADGVRSRDRRAREHFADHAGRRARCACGESAPFALWFVHRRRRSIAPQAAACECEPIYALARTVGVACDAVDVFAGAHAACVVGFIRRRRSIVFRKRRQVSANRSTRSRAPSVLVATRSTCLRARTPPASWGSTPTQVDGFRKQRHLSANRSTRSRAPSVLIATRSTWSLRDRRCNFRGDSFSC